MYTPPGALAMVTDTPFMKGSILEDGAVRTTFKGDDMAAI